MDTKTQNEPAEAVIIAHIASHLGQVQEGWTPGGSNPEGGNISLVRYSYEPEHEWVVLGSFGLGRLPLVQSNGAELRQEVLVCWPAEDLTDSLLTHIYSIAQTIAVTGVSLGRGALVPIPAEPALNSDRDEPYVAWYASVPYFLPSTGVVCEAVTPPLLLTWLLPVYASEVEFIAANGVEAFEDIILASREACFSWPRLPLV